MYIDIRGGSFEIVYVRCTDRTYIFCVSRNEVCELGIDLESGWCGGGYPWNLVNGVGQPLHFCFPTTVHTPYGVREWFRTGVHFGSHRSLA